MRLERNVKTRILKKGEIVYKEGEIGNSIFRVDDSGQDNVELEAIHGSIAVHKYRPGDSFGE